MHNARVMATPKPGEIRCPTCHRSTPPAAFCTQCGSAIPTDARARPRGMDRDELQDRIRARRSGGEPYRRGSESEEGTGIYDRFEPDPTDQMRRPAAGPAEPRQDLLDETAAASRPPRPPERPDLTREQDDWSESTPPPPPIWAAPGVEAPAEPPPAEGELRDEPPYAQAPEGQWEEGYDYGDQYVEWDEGRERTSAGTWAIVGFLGLGVLALLAGAVLASLWGGGIGQVDETPTPDASFVASAQPSDAPSVAPSATPDASGSATASGGPIEFPDGFVAEAQPCIPGSVGSSGCDSNGVSNNGSVEIWVGFQNGNASDVIGAILEAPDGTEFDQSIDLARIGCGSTCNGYTWFQFSNLDPGDYEVRITRNGEPAGSTTFEVT
jgi:hypothetical protein